MTWQPHGARRALSESAAGRFCRPDNGPAHHGRASRPKAELIRTSAVLHAAAPLLMAAALCLPAPAAYAASAATPAVQGDTTAAAASPTDRAAAPTAQTGNASKAAADESEHSMVMLGLATAAVLLLVARRRFVR